MNRRSWCQKGHLHKGRKLVSLVLPINRRFTKTRRVFKPRVPGSTVRIFWVFFDTIEHIYLAFRQFSPFSAPFWAIWWITFWIILGPNWDQFGWFWAILGWSGVVLRSLGGHVWSFVHRFGIIVGSFWPHFEAFLGPFWAFSANYWVVVWFFL